MKILFAALHQGYYRNLESAIVELARRGHDVYLGHERQDSAIGGQSLVDRLTAALAAYGVVAAMFAWAIAPLARAQQTAAPGITDIPLQIISEHPLGPTDPETAKLIERAITVLTTEFGDGLTFRVTMPRRSSDISSPCDGATYCEELLKRFGPVPEFLTADEPLTSEFPTPATGPLSFQQILLPIQQIPAGRQVIILKIGRAHV